MKDVQVMKEFVVPTVAAVSLSESLVEVHAPHPPKTDWQGGGGRERAYRDRTKVSVFPQTVVLPHCL